MKKLNNKGFVLAETMVVAVFIMTIFGIIYVNFYPLMAQYERREFYDDIDSKYDVYWFKRMIENKAFVSQGKINDLTNQIKNNAYVSITCNTLFTDNKYLPVCQQYWTASGITKLYITSFHLGESSVNSIKTNDILNGRTHLQDEAKLNSIPNDEDLIDYIRYLPKYNYGSLNEAKYRIIAEFNREYHSGTYKSFATIEVVR